MFKNSLVKALKGKRNEYHLKRQNANNNIEIDLYSDIIHDLDRIIKRHEIAEDNIPF